MPRSWIACGVQDHAAFCGRERAGRGGGEAARRGIAVDLGGGACVDIGIVGRRHRRSGDRRHRRAEQGIGGVEPALVEQVERQEVAAQALLDRIVGRHLPRLVEQCVSLRELAEVRALQRAVDDVLAEHGARGTIAGIAAVGKRVEELGRLGVVAGIVAAIALGERLCGIERAGLHAREGDGIADRGGGGGDLAGDDAIGDDGAQPELQRAVIAGEALGDIDGAAARDAVDRIADILLRAGAGGDLRVGKIGDLAGRGHGAGDVGVTHRRQPRERIVARAAAQRIEVADRRGGIPGRRSYRRDRTCP